MALWIVRSWGGVDVESDGSTDPVQLIGRHGESGTGRAITVDLVEVTSDEGMQFLRSQPNVLSLALARDGVFQDDTEGEIRICDGGSRWELAIGQTDEPTKGQTEPNASRRPFAA